MSLWEKFEKSIVRNFVQGQKNIFHILEALDTPAGKAALISWGVPKPIVALVPFARKLSALEVEALKIMEQRPDGRLTEEELKKFRKAVVDLMKEHAQELKTAFGFLVPNSYVHASNETDPVRTARPRPVHALQYAAA